MRPHPRLASLALLVIAAVHAWWGLRMLLVSELLFAGSQLVSVGGLVLAAVAMAHASRTGLALGLGIAALASLLRLASPLVASSPFVAPGLLLSFALALAAWGAWRLAARPRDGAGALALRGGGVLLSLAYALYVAVSFAAGTASAQIADFVVRGLAALVFALAIDAPPLALGRKTFADEPASAAR